MGSDPSYSATRELSRYGHGSTFQVQIGRENHPVKSTVVVILTMVYENLRSRRGTAKHRSRKVSPWETSMSAKIPFPQSSQLPSAHTLGREDASTRNYSAHCCRTSRRTNHHRNPNRSPPRQNMNVLQGSTERIPSIRNANRGAKLPKPITTSGWRPTRPTKPHYG